MEGFCDNLSLLTPLKKKRERKKEKEFGREAIEKKFKNNVTRILTYISTQSMTSVRCGVRKEPSLRGMASRSFTGLQCSIFGQHS